MDEDPDGRVGHRESRGSWERLRVDIDPRRDQQQRPTHRRDYECRLPPVTKDQSQEDDGRDHVNALRPVSCSLRATAGLRKGLIRTI